jgi:hypothetical protein
VGSCQKECRRRLCEQSEYVSVVVRRRPAVSSLLTASSAVVLRAPCGVWLGVRLGFLAAGGGRSVCQR